MDLRAIILGMKSQGECFVQNVVTPSCETSELHEALIYAQLWQTTTSPKSEFQRHLHFVTRFQPDNYNTAYYDNIFFYFMTEHGFTLSRLDAFVHPYINKRLDFRCSSTNLLLSKWRHCNR